MRYQHKNNIGPNNVVNGTVLQTSSENDAAVSREYAINRDWEYLCMMHFVHLNYHFIMMEVHVKGRLYLVITIIEF